MTYYIVLILTLLIFFSILFLNPSKKLNYIPYDNILKSHSINNYNVPLVSSLVVIPTLVFFTEKIILLIYLGLYILGLFDDKYSITVNKRFVFSFILVLVSLILFQEFRISHIYFFDHRYNLNILISISFSLLMIMGLFHVINMSDGRNCLATIYCINIIIFIIFNNSQLNISSVDESLLLISFILIFILNYFSKSFYGNSGILIIAFLISYLLINEFNANKLSIENIYFLLYLPFLDGLRVTFTRVFNKKSPFLSDKNHLHHFPKNWNLSLLILTFLFILNFAIQYITNLNFYLLILYSLISYFFVFIIFKRI